MIAPNGAHTDDEPGHPLTGEHSIHFFTQGKGGVGKSLGATLTLQYLLTKYAGTRGWDTDPTNHTLANFKALPVDLVPIMENNKVHIERFDDLLTKLVERGPQVVDTGATNFPTFWDYAVQNDLFPYLREVQHKRVLIHCPIVGGQALADTLQGFHTMAQYVQPESMVIWKNGYFGPVEGPDKNGIIRPLEEFAAIRENIEKIVGFVEIGAPTVDLWKMDLSKLVRESLTFPEALTGTRFNMMERHRLKRQQDEIYRQLEGLGL